MWLAMVEFADLNVHDVLDEVRPGSCLAILYMDACRPEHARRAGRGTTWQLPSDPVHAGMQT